MTQHAVRLLTICVIGLLLGPIQRCHAQSLQGTAYGLRARWYQSPSSLYNLPPESFYDSRTPSLLNTVPNLDYAVVGNSESGGLNAVSGGILTQYAARFDGFVSIASAGSWTFCTSSDDGSRLFLASTLLVNNDGQHRMFEVCGTRNLARGQHAIVVDFFENEGGQGLIVSWSGPGVAKQAVPPSALRCDTCAVGSFQNATGQQATCVPCFLGTYCPSAGVSSPVPCEVGKFQDVSGSSNCKACSPGSFCSAAGLITPNGVCPVGSFCPAGASAPTICPKGSYCETTGLPKAVPCPSGNYCASTGMASAGAACKVGGYCPAGSSNPVLCPAGSYCPAPGLPSPVLCPAGSYCPEDGMSSHIPCPGGSTCPAGSTQPQTDSGNGSNQDPNLVWKIVGPIAGVISIIASCAAICRVGRSSEVGQGAGAVSAFAGSWSV
jgi:hypothetical protein